MGGLGMDRAAKQRGKGNFTKGDAALLQEKGDEMKEPERSPPHTSTRSPDSGLALAPWPLLFTPQRPSPCPCQPHVLLNLHFLIFLCLLTELLGLLQNGRLSLPECA